MHQNSITEESASACMAFVGLLRPNILIWLCNNFCLWTRFPWTWNQGQSQPLAMQKFYGYIESSSLGSIDSSHVSALDGHLLPQNQYKSTYLYNVLINFLSWLDTSLDLCLTFPYGASYLRFFPVLPFCKECSKVPSCETQTYSPFLGYSSTSGIRLYTMLSQNYNVKEHLVLYVCRQLTEWTEIHSGRKRSPCHQVGH